MTSTTPYRYFTTDPSQVHQVVLSDATKKDYPGAFSATDIYAVMNLPAIGNNPPEVRPFGTLAAVSISTHRDTFPVTSMPYVSPRGFTQGHRTVAGTLMFNTIDRGAFTPIPTSIHKHPDEFPLFDILLVYVNEVGMQSFEQLIGVRILDFGKTLALENLQPIESYSYMALDYLPLKSLVNKVDVARSFFLQKNTNRKQQPVSNAGSFITPDAKFDPMINDNTGSDPLPTGDVITNSNLLVSNSGIDPSSTTG